MTDIEPAYRRRYGSGRYNDKFPMCNVAVAILFSLAIDADAQELGVTRIGDELDTSIGQVAPDSLNVLVDRAVNKLFNWAFQVSPLRHADLVSSSFGKSTQLSRSSRIRPSHSFPVPGYSFRGQVHHLDGSSALSSAMHQSQFQTEAARNSQLYAADEDDAAIARSSLLRMASAGVALAPVNAYAAPSLPKTMTAAQYTSNGDDIAKLVDFVKVPVPQVKPGQVLIKVEYASANPIDIGVLKGNLKGAGWAMPFPFTLGYDVAGKVVVGAEGFKEGQRVFAVNWGQGKHDSGDDPIGGTFAEYAVIPASKLTAIPDGLGSREAAAVALVGTTAYQIVVDCAKVTSGSKVLILGGATAVGSLAVQLAKLRGASFVATTASTRNLEYVRTLGADKVIDYKQADWTLDPALKDLDDVIDTSGEQNVFAKAKGVLKKDGDFVSIANFDAGFDPSANPPLSFAAFFGFSHSRQVQEKLAELLSSGKLKLKIDEEFPFTKAGIIALLEKQNAGKSVGKNLLKIAATV